MSANNSKISYDFNNAMRTVAVALMVIMVLIGFFITLNSRAQVGSVDCITGGDNFYLSPANAKSVAVISDGETENGQKLAAVSGEAQSASPAAKSSAASRDPAWPTDKNGSDIESDIITATQTADKKSWSQLEKLDIFSNAEFNGDKLIAPGTTGSYKFSLGNNAKFPISCTLNLSDKNEHSVPMEYVLTNKNGSYLLGNANNWFSLTSPVSMKFDLAEEEKTDLVLIWRWIFEAESDILSQADSHDTGLGSLAFENQETGGVMYYLNLDISAEQNGAVSLPQSNPNPSGAGASSDSSGGNVHGDSDVTDDSNPSGSNPSGGSNVSGVSGDVSDGSGSGSGSGGESGSDISGSTSGGESGNISGGGVSGWNISGSSGGSGFGSGSGSGSGSGYNEHKPSGIPATGDLFSGVALALMLIGLAGCLALAFTKIRNKKN